MKRVVWIFLFAFWVLSVTASAQSRGSYFFEHSLLRSKLNPAFAPQTDYTSFPGVGSFSVDMASNVGLRHFLFPEGDANALYLSDAVPADAFLSQLPDRNPYLQKRVESDLFGFGMKIGRNGYATLSLSLVEHAQAELSGELLRYTKVGDPASQSLFDGGSVQLAGYAALAAGYSHDLSRLVEGLRVGARFKMLFGLACGRFTLDQLGLQAGPEQISARIHGTGSLSGIAYRPGKGFSLAWAGLGSLGAAIDFGASYWLPMEGPWTLSGIEFSAAVCDLGGIRYGHRLSSLTLDHQFAFSGIGNLTGDLKAEFEQTLADLTAFIQMESADGEPFLYGLPTSIHVGATAHLLQDKLLAGLLYYHAVGHSNLMIAAGFSPFEWLNLNANWTFLGPANRLGFYAEFIPRKYISLFLGMERASLFSNSSHIPIRNFTESIGFGVNVLFGP